MIKKLLIMIGLSVASGFFASIAIADQDNNGLGETIKIRTNLHTFVGKPAWLLIIRDIDHNQNIPYLYDFRKGTNFWLAFTYGRNYVITVSELVFNPYERKIKNFCNLESMGAIQHGISLDIHITGDLSPRTDTFHCNIMRYANANFDVDSED